MTREYAPTSLESDASDAFVERLYGEWTAANQRSLEERLERDPAYANAYRRVEESWSALDTHAETPELMAYREEAIGHVRRANARRWRPTPSLVGWRAAAAIVVFALFAVAAWQLSPYGFRVDEYRTGIGEQRSVELEDHSRVSLDAATRLRVHFSSDARLVELKEGQAQFVVAHDPARPFKVQVGDQTIVAVGTVFTVEYFDGSVRVAMMEGRVSVVPPMASAPLVVPGPENTDSKQVAQGGGSPTEIGATADQETNRRTGAIELSAGEELRVSRSGRATVIPKADIEAAVAWREGKVIFRTESLGEAVRRVNRYSNLMIRIDDDALAARHISGVFEAGDTQGFVDAIQRYLPVAAVYVDSSTIELKPR